MPRIWLNGPLRRTTDVARKSNRQRKDLFIIRDNPNNPSLVHHIHEEASNLLRVRVRGRASMEMPEIFKIGIEEISGGRTFLLRSGTLREVRVQEELFEEIAFNNHGVVTFFKVLA